MRNRQQLFLTCVAIFCAIIFAENNAHGQKKGKGGHKHGGGHHHGGGGRSFIDISPWGIGYGFQNNNFGISIGPIGGGGFNGGGFNGGGFNGGGFNGGFNGGFDGGWGGPVYNSYPVYDSYVDPYYGQPVLPMATPGYNLPPQPTYYTPQGMTTSGPVMMPPGNPANFGNGMVSPTLANPGVSNSQPSAPQPVTSSNIPGRPVGNTWFDQSLTAFRNGDYANANRLAMHALLDAPDNGWLKLYASQCQLAVGNFVASAELVATGLETAPDEQWNSVVANFREFYDRNDYVTHIKALEDKVQKEDTSSWGKALLGYHYLFLGHPESAKKALDASLQINPKDPIAVRLQPLAKPVTTSKPGNVDSPTPAIDAGRLPPLQLEEIPAEKSLLNR